MQFGLEEKVIDKVNQVLSLHPRVEQAVIFGSRAKGNFKIGSDIDLALKGVGITLTVINQLSNEIDDLLLPYSFDLISFSEISNSELLEHINRVGIVFYKQENIPHSL